MTNPTKDESVEYPHWAHHEYCDINESGPDFEIGTKPCNCYVAQIEAQKARIASVEAKLRLATDALGVFASGDVPEVDMEDVAKAALAKMEGRRDE